MDTKKQVAKVWFGEEIFIEGILLDNMGEKPVFGVAFPQVYAQFLLPQKNGARTLKALLGKAQLLPQKVKIEGEIYKRAVDVLTLDEYDTIVEELAFDGNEEARNFMRLLRGLSLNQLFHDAFELKFEKQERQLWLTERTRGKLYRRGLTDAVQARKLLGEKIDYSWVTMEVYKNCGLDSEYYNYKLKNKDAKFRNTLSEEELMKIAKCEELAADYMLIDNVPYKEAVRQTAKYIR